MLNKKKNQFRTESNIAEKLKNQNRKLQNKVEHLIKQFDGHDGREISSPKRSNRRDTSADLIFELSPDKSVN